MLLHALTIFVDCILMIVRSFASGIPGLPDSFFCGPFSVFRKGILFHRAVLFISLFLRVLRKVLTRKISIWRIRKHQPGEIPGSVAGKTGISRPAFTRAYNRALKKTAKAFVECKSIEIEGGHVEFEKQWFKCKQCFKLIERIENDINFIGCDSYGGTELINLNEIPGF